MCASYSSYCTKMVRSRRDAEKGEAALVRELMIQNESHSSPPPMVNGFVFANIPCRPALTTRTTVM